MPSKTTAVPDLSSSVATQFLDALVEKGVDQNVVTRLRKVMMSQDRVTKQALEDALFNKQSLP